MSVLSPAPAIGPLLRDWRQRRRLSQLDLALEAGVSARHLSFVETGRSRPSAAMVLLLAERLEVPLRQRNALLLAAGYAPAYRTRELADPDLGPVREAVRMVLDGHDPYPAAVVDQRWDLVAGNRGLDLLTAGVAPWLLVAPVNVIRLSLHPDGAARRILNLGEWRGHLLDRLARQFAVTADAALGALIEEVTGYPAPPPDGPAGDGRIVVPLRVRGDGDAVLTFFGTITTFGTAVDVTVAELSIEAFYPADAATRAAVRAYEAASGRVPAARR